MNDIALSTDLKQIEFEIDYHKQVAGQSIWEIGRRLNHVKDNDLAHGEFIEWVESKLEMDRSEAYRFMRVSKELPNDETFHHLGGTALYLIATLPEEEREKEHVTEKGEVKSPEEMTVRELQELKRQLKQKDTQISLKEKRIESLTQRNEDLEFKASQPKVVEKEVVKEVKPHDYDGLKSDNQQLSRALKEQRNENEKMRKQIDQWQAEQGELNEKSKRYDELNRAIKEMEGKMDSGQKRIAVVKDITSKLKTGNQLIDELSGLIYLADYDELSRNEFLSQEMAKLVRRLNAFTNDLNERLNQTTILEGEIIDG